MPPPCMNNPQARRSTPTSAPPSHSPGRCPCPAFGNSTSRTHPVGRGATEHACLVRDETTQHFLASGRAQGATEGTHLARLQNRLPHPRLETRPAHRHPGEPSTPCSTLRRSRPRASRSQHNSESHGGREHQCVVTRPRTPPSTHEVDHAAATTLLATSPCRKRTRSAIGGVRRPGKAHIDCLALGRGAPRGSPDATPGAAEARLKAARGAPRGTPRRASRQAGARPMPPRGAPQGRPRRPLTLGWQPHATPRHGPRARPKACLGGGP